MTLQYSLHLLFYEIRIIVAIYIYTRICQYFEIIDKILIEYINNFLSELAVLNVTIESYSINLYRGYVIFYNLSILSPDDPIWTLEKIIEIKQIDFNFDLYESIYYAIISNFKVIKLHMISIDNMRMYVESWEDPISGEQYLNTDLIGIEADLVYNAPVYDSNEVIQHTLLHTQQHTKHSGAGTGHTTSSSLPPPLPSLDDYTDIKVHTRRLRMPVSYTRTPTPTEPPTKMSSIVAGTYVC